MSLLPECFIAMRTSFAQLEVPSHSRYQDHVSPGCIPNQLLGSKHREHVVPPISPQDSARSRRLCQNSSSFALRDSLTIIAAEHPIKHVSHILRIHGVTFCHSLRPPVILLPDSFPQDINLPIHLLHEINHTWQNTTAYTAMSMVSQTLQGAVLSATSNILAQAISSYQDKVSLMTYLNPRS